MTLTIVSVRKPEKVLKMLCEKRKYKIIDTETPGIYYIYRDGAIPDKIQLVVSSQLPNDESDQSLVWLRALRNDLTPEEAVETVKRAENADDHEQIWHVVDFILDVNSDILPEVKKMKSNPKLQKFYEDVALESGIVHKFVEEGRKDVARKMIAKNKFSFDEIAEYTGLSRADIVTIAALT